MHTTNDFMFVSQITESTIHAQKFFLNLALIPYILTLVKVFGLLKEPNVLKVLNALKVKDLATHARPLWSPKPKMKGRLAGPLEYESSTYKVSVEDNRILREAVANCIEIVGSNLGKISRDTFKLGGLGDRLREWSWNLHNVTPFILIQGVEQEGYGEKELAVLFAGISSYIGDQRGVQNGNLDGKNCVMLNIINLADKMEKDQFIASANGTRSMPYHSDGDGDIVALQYRNVALRGGNILLAPSWGIYNYLLDHYPEVIETLQQDFEWDCPGNNPGYKKQPLLHFTANPVTSEPQAHLQIEYRPFFGDPKAPRKAMLKPMTEKQKEALDKVKSVAASMALEIRPKSGDLLYLNNRCILHARTSYQDVTGDAEDSITEIANKGSVEPKIEERRHVARLILRDQEYGWPCPRTMVWAREIFDRAAQPENQYFQLKPAPLNKSGQHG